VFRVFRGTCFFESLGPDRTPRSFSDFRVNPPDRRLEKPHSHPVMPRTVAADTYVHR
jgi:hypothetical protein